MNILCGTPLYCDNQGVIFDSRWEREIEENKYSNELVCLGCENNTDWEEKIFCHRS